MFNKLLEVLRQYQRQSGTAFACRSSRNVGTVYKEKIPIEDWKKEDAYDATFFAYITSHERRRAKPPDTLTIIALRSSDWY